MPAESVRLTRGKLRGLIVSWLRYAERVIDEKPRVEEGYSVFVVNYSERVFKRDIEKPVLVYAGQIGNGRRESLSFLVNTRVRSHNSLSRSRSLHYSRKFAQLLYRYAGVEPLTRFRLNEYLFAETERIDNLYDSVDSVVVGPPP